LRALRNLARVRQRQAGERERYVELVPPLVEGSRLVPVSNRMHRTLDRVEHGVGRVVPVLAGRQRRE
jgi:hypothetical protein